jgi:hypothetical protein
MEGMVACSDLWLWIPLSVVYCTRVEFFFKREGKKGGRETDNSEAEVDRNKRERMRGKRAEAG